MKFGSLPAFTARFSFAAAVALALLAIAAPAHGQGNPLDQAPPPAAGVGAVGERWVVPEFIKPGARFVYESMHTQQSPDPVNKPGGGSSGAGLMVTDVLVVTDALVLLEMTNYTKFGLSGNIARTGSQALIVRKGDASRQVLGALWLDKAALDNMAKLPDYQVVREQWPMAGTTYNAIVFTRIKPEGASRHVYDADGGMLLASQLATGQPRVGGDPTGFNREVSSTTTLSGRRQRELPWVDGAKAADWTRTVRRFRYDGMQTMLNPMVPVPGIPISLSGEVKERGEGWAVIDTQVQYQGQPATSTQAIASMTKIGSHWLSPDALRSLRQGMLDEDPVTGAVLRYAVEETPSGRMGVFVEGNSANAYEALWAYRLDDGALAYSRLQVKELSMQIEAQLAGRE